MQQTLWCLWEPPGSLPGYLGACLKTIERNAGLPVHLLSPADVEVLAPAMDPELAARVERPGQRSDYYRSHLLAAQGGIWMDVDSIVLRDLSFVVDALKDHVGLAARRGVDGRVSTSPLASVRDHPAMNAWIAAQERLLKDARVASRLPWTALGATSLTVAVADWPLFELPSALVAPVRWQDADRFLSRFQSPATTLHGDPATVMLYNARFPDRLRQASEAEVLASQTMLGRLLRIALGTASPQDYHRPTDRLAEVAHATAVVRSAVRQRIRGGRDR